MRNITRAGYSLIEALVAVGVGIMLFVIAYWILSGATRTGTRGQVKLEGSAQAELVMRTLGEDLHAAIGRPVLGENPTTLVLERAVLESAAAPPGKAKVEWKFEVKPGGRGSRIERRTTAGPDRGDPMQQFCVDRLEEASLRPLSPDQPDLLVARIAMRAGEKEPVTIYQEVICVRNQIPDPDWNPIEEATTP